MRRVRNLFTLAVIAAAVEIVLSFRYCPRYSQMANYTGVFVPPASCQYMSAYGSYSIRATVPWDETGY